MDFYVLQDFLTFTKGTCYVLMFIILVAFITFLIFLKQTKKK
jgi:hypothetical protein